MSHRAAVAHERERERDPHADVAHDRPPAVADISPTENAVSILRFLAVVSRPLLSYACAADPACACAR